VVSAGFVSRCFLFSPAVVLTHDHIASDLIPICNVVFRHVIERYRSPAAGTRSPSKDDCGLAILLCVSSYSSVRSCDD
jgi:hypothetical protein